MIYYAHSKRIYNTKREGKELAYLKKKYGMQILDPNNNMGELGSMEPYLEKVRRCNTLVCSEFDKHVGRGVYSEIAEALKHKKKVFVLRRNLLGFRLHKVKGLEITDDTDWKVYYGKVCS